MPLSTRLIDDSEDEFNVPRTIWIRSQDLKKLDPTPLIALLEDSPLQLTMVVAKTALYIKVEPYNNDEVMALMRLIRRHFPRSISIEGFASAGVVGL